MASTNKKNYLTPSIKVVKFQIEQGFAPSSIHQPTTDAPGMNEKMNYNTDSDNNSLNWDWHVN